MPEAYVYLYLKEGPVPVGLLEMLGTGREATATFRYGRRYLQREDRLSIDPVQLPLTDPDDDRQYRAPEDFPPREAAQSFPDSLRFSAELRWCCYMVDCTDILPSSAA